MKKLILILLFPFLFAAKMGPKHITGTLTSMDGKIIKVTNKNFTYEIPKKLVSIEHLKAGKQVDIAIKTSQFSQVKIKKH